MASPARGGDGRASPSRGYTTVGFSNEQDGQRGELDKYCSMERGFYFVAVAIMYASDQHRDHHHC